MTTIATNETETKKEASKQWLTPYEFKSGNTDISITAGDVYNMIASGYAKPNINECKVFLELCKAQGLNPFLKDAYLMKYKDTEPATIVVGKNAFMKRAESNHNYRGFTAGLIVENELGAIEYKEGSFVSKNLTVLGGWCKVFRSDREHPFLIEVDINEYIGKKKDGEKNQQWATKEKTMIRKVAIVQCLREAFPQELNALYVEEEFYKKNVVETEVIKDELTPEHLKWDAAVKSYRDTGSFETIEKHYSITEYMKNKIIEVSKHA